MSILQNNYGEQQCTLPFLTTLTMNWSADFLGDQRQMMLGQYHLVDSVVNELSIVFRADLPDLATWRP
jgi:hypothetical protein